MKNTNQYYVLGCVALAGALLTVSAVAAPNTITYQGSLTSPSGDPVPDGTYTMEFSIWNALAGGTRAWQETGLTVAISKGAFSVELGKTVALGTLFDSPVLFWLEIHANVGGSMQTFAPRAPLTAVPYALQATSADNADNADMVDGKHANEFATAVHTQDWTTITGKPTAFPPSTHQHAGADITSGKIDNARLNMGIGNGLDADKLDGFDASYYLNASMLVTGKLDNARLNTGAGGGLDADKVDGKDASAFANATHAHSGADITSGKISNDRLNTGSGNGLDADKLDGQHAADLPFWKLGGNDIDPFTQFLGTIANDPLDIKVNNTRVLRFEPTTGTPNLIGGHAANLATAGVQGAAIGGGGQFTGGPEPLALPNVVTDDFGTVGGGMDNGAGNGAGTTSDASFAAVGGGYSNYAGNYSSTIAGGWSNSASGYAATVGGGWNNDATGYISVIAGGDANTATDGRASVGGGYDNHATAPNAAVGGGVSNNASGETSVVAGGGVNTASGQNATIAGGENNAATAHYATVGGGRQNTATADYATIAGGGPSDPTANPPVKYNRAIDNYCTIGGGGGNCAGYDDDDPTNSTYATVGGGNSNTATGGGATIGGGEGNKTNNYWATVGGGVVNQASGLGATVAGGYINMAYYEAAVGGGEGNGATGDRSTIGGGFGNKASAGNATIGGGEMNKASGEYAAVGGGKDNTASGNHATVPGGEACEAGGNYSFAAGLRGKAIHEGAFVWADSTEEDFNSAGIDSFTVRARGGVQFWTGVGLGSWLQPNGTGWTSLSDRNVKENFTEVPEQEILEKVAALPVTTWNLKGADPAVRHMGPMAQDFYAAFGLGDTDKGINTVDADGVALAAIQGLNKKVEQQQTEIAELKQQVAALTALVQNLAQK